MAIFHLNVKNISRGGGRSIVAAAAYRAGEVLPNEAEERLSDFGGRRDVVASEIRLPAGAPRWMAERARLWNAVEATEKRKDARLAKEVEFALPIELPRSEWLAVARTMADAYTSQGFVVDLAIHDDGARRNPHVHMMMSTRGVGSEGFGLKIRSADGTQFVTEARALWERVANEALSKAGLAVTIDSRSYAKRRIGQEPGQHRGPNPEERRAHRIHAQRERELMAPTEPDEELPVPDPDGSPIHPRELEAAEDRMLDDMHQPASAEVFHPDGDLEAAQRVVDRQNGLEMSEDDAAAYRLTPENMLDWLDDKTRTQDVETLERWENHLDWLDVGNQRPSAPEDGEWQEPDRDRR
ncbi:conjugal transfer protein [Mesorhizobium sp. B3-1-3]|uniref:MobA/MobL family protein n=1 Tax=unclassified Mesorhizobium TaxID=325217 RepID=UPI00112BE7A5|nr:MULTISPECIES: MobA/MobL family protein [unclassified Mesorhizobium]TPI54189.1 conjugal transfer protein [Mesorhizobium sp. B3-1-8]TPI61449.1 conjugal transfer protein [Mesorhizobium sp. B3-1-3]